MTTPCRALVRVVGGWLAVIAYSTGGHGYDLETHRQLSAQAFALSEIAPALEGYGIRPTDALHGPLPFFISERRTPAVWVAEGGRQEDFPDWRVRHHFYDPFYDAPLTIRGIAAGVRAPDWALEDAGSFLEQRFSYQDARDAFYRGLTDPDLTTRSRNLGHTFYALGHVIHMVQDMAQPQHTRNDPHPIGTSWRSWLEAYVDANVRRFSLSGAAIPPLQPSRQLRDLWVTGTGPAGTGFGFAEFTNRNFVSAGTNFTALSPGATAENYPSPALNLGLRDDGPAGTCRDGARAPASANPLTFYSNVLPDLVTGSPLLNPRMTTHSVFDQYLVERSKPPVFALNCFNHDAAADILLPRAVAYSAALLRYFFRGRLEAAVQVFQQASGELGARVFITNPSSDEVLAGSFALYYDTADGRRRPLVEPTEVRVLLQGESTVLEVPRLPPDLAFTPWTAVFRGSLGLELDTVVGQRIGVAYQVWLSHSRSESSDTPGVTERDVQAGPSGVAATPGAVLQIGAGEGVGRGAAYVGTSLTPITTSSAGGSVGLLALDPDLLPDATLTVEFLPSPWTACGGLIQERVFSRDVTTALPFTAATAELVELEPPADLAALRAYTYAQLPAARRVRLAWSSQDTGTRPLDVRGVRLLGVRLTTHPTDPGPVSLEGDVVRRSVGHSCQATLYLRVP